MFANLGRIAASTLEKISREKRGEDEGGSRNKKQKLPIQTFAPFNVRNEEERDELPKSLQEEGIKR